MTRPQVGDFQVAIGVLSDNRNWHPQKEEIDIRNPFLSMGMDQSGEIMSVAYAQEANKLDKEVDVNKLKSFWTGGYYPLLLAHGVFDLLRKRDLLSPSEIEEIENMFDSFELVSKGISIRGATMPLSSLFRGFSFLRFHEIVLNALIKKKIFTVEEAKEILQTSRDAGGTRFSGYNVIVLDVEILNNLIRKGYINRAEGQQIVDNAKVERKEDGK